MIDRVRHTRMTNAGFRVLALGLLAGVLALAGCSQEGARYTLYRHGSVTAGMTPDDQAAAAKARVHVATFNAHRLDAHNEDNCRIAAELFSHRAGTPGSYWCELGPYHP